MSQVTYNQTGYIGKSMSRRAAQAYEQGEKPASKWTKTLMVETINSYLSDMSDCTQSEAETLTSEISKNFTKTGLFDRFFEQSSWHHTGKYANATNFYQLDEKTMEDCIEERFPRIKTLKAERKAEAERREREREDAQDEELSKEITAMLENNVCYPGFFELGEIIGMADEIWGDKDDYKTPDIQLNPTKLYEYANGHEYKRFKMVVHNPTFTLADSKTGRDYVVFTIERWELKEFFNID